MFHFIEIKDLFLFIFLKVRKDKYQNANDGHFVSKIIYNCILLFSISVFTKFSIMNTYSFIAKTIFSYLKLSPRHAHTPLHLFHLIFSPKEFINISHLFYLFLFLCFFSESLNQIENSYTEMCCYLSWMQSDGQLNIFECMSVFYTQSSLN